MVLTLVWGLVLLTVKVGAENPAPWCTEAKTVQFGGNLTQLYDCPAVSPLLVLPYLWSPVKITIKCSSSWYSVFTANDEGGLVSAIDAKEVAWCGVDSILDGSICSMQVSPFQRTLVGIKSTRSCIVTSNASTSYFMLGSGLLGLFFFYAAGLLSSSIVFRLSCGTALFTAGSLLILLVLMFRFVPHKKTMATAMAAAGSSGVALLRWLTGQWLPSWHQLVRNRFFALYVVLSAGIGAAATYIYDDRNNYKVNVIIKLVLRMAGLALVYTSTWTLWPLSATVMALLVASIMGGHVIKSVHDTTQHVQRVAGATVNVLSTPFRSSPRRPAGATPYTQGVTPYTASRVQLPQSLPRVGRDGSTANATPYQEAKDEEPDRMSPTEFEFTPLHLRTPPPDPWTVQPRRRVHTFEEKVTAAAIASAGRRTTTVTRSSARVASGSTLTGRAADEGLGSEELEGSEVAADGVSPLVRSGYILNLSTGRPIKFGGDLYLRLLEQGYVANTAAGVIQPPAEELELTAGRSTGKRKSVMRTK